MMHLDRLLDFFEFFIGHADLVRGDNNLGVREFFAINDSSSEHEVGGLDYPVCSKI